MVMQQELYEGSVKPIVSSVFEGYNGTVFAYGQTGTGKTHTMEGDVSSEAEKGVMSRVFDTVFNEIEKLGEGKKYLVRSSYLEIYKEDI